MQNPQQMECREPRFRALIPFFVFIVFYLGLSIWARDFYKVPMPTAFLVASAANGSQRAGDTLAPKAGLIGGWAAGGIPAIEALALRLSS